jgi:PiT family inorganic phosphate transporter
VSHSHYGRRQSGRDLSRAGAAQALFGQGLGAPTRSPFSPEFLLAVALGAGATVILAIVLGFPISTTHSLTAALLGAGLLDRCWQRGSRRPGEELPGAVVTVASHCCRRGAVLNALLRGLRLELGIGKEFCVCVGTETQTIPIPRPDGLFAADALPQLCFTADEPVVCQQKYTGTFLGISMARAADLVHFASAGAVSFARGLNDTPKIAALPLIVTSLETRWSTVTVAVAIRVVFHASSMLLAGKSTTQSGHATSV